MEIDRPFHGYLFILFYKIIGLQNNVYLWHIFTFLARLVGGYALFFSLKKIFENKLSFITTITLAYLIYPGFMQQTTPLGFAVWVTNLTIWILSFLFTVLSLKNNSKLKSIFYIFIALFLQINTFLQIEFFIGMEIFRLLMITFILKNEITFKSLRKTLPFYIPYILTLIIFMIWRIFIFKSTREVTNINWVLENYYTNPFWALRFSFELIHSFFQTLIFAYFIPIIINFIRLPFYYLIIAAIFGVTVSFLLYLYYKAIKYQNIEQKEAKNLLLIGIISVIGALVPIIVSGRVVRMFMIYDRYTITSIIGVSFILVGLLSLKFTQRFRKWTILVLVFLSTTSHTMNSLYRVDNWQKQKDIWWQLYWRTPNIESGAMLIFDFLPRSENTPFKDFINKVQWYRIYWVDEQLWTIGNLFFNYNTDPTNHFRGDYLSDKNITDKIKKKAIEEMENRKITFTRNFGNSVMVIAPSDTSCLWVSDNKRNELPTFANKMQKENVIYSDIDKLIKTNKSVTPPAAIFGREPSHNWCYYFQKASLLRQFGEWDKLSALKEEVIKKALKPKDPNEWLPFEKDLR